MTGDETSDGAVDHQPVMLREVIEALALEKGGTVVDATAGRGGHAEAIAREIGSRGTLVLMDLDRRNLDFAGARVRALPQAPRVEAVHGNFAGVARALRERSLRADAFLADLGFASNQMSDPARGFSFAASGPLDMRLDQSRGESAESLLVRVSEAELADLIYELGEDPFSRRIARRIIQVRDSGRLQNTADLAKAVVDAYGSKAPHSRMHPATRTFMALRIAVNRELESLSALLSDIQREIAGFHPIAPEEARTGGASSASPKHPPNPTAAGASDGGTAGNWLAENTRMAILAFHSLEDRLIKRAFADWERHGWALRLTRKPLIAGDAECRANPRARSAKLRSVRLTGV